MEMLLEADAVAALGVSAVVLAPLLALAWFGRWRPLPLRMWCELHGRNGSKLFALSPIGWEERRKMLDKISLKLSKHNGNVKQYKFEINSYYYWAGKKLKNNKFRVVI